MDQKIEGNKITVLSEATVQALRCSQIIIKTSCVVKELVENAIDAGCSSIDVKLDNYGLDVIEVRDDGTGIRPVDLQILGSAHCTSKITDTSDLDDLRSYGFRGEAFHAICCMANVSLVSRHKEEENGTMVLYDSNGKIKCQKPYPAKQGTTVTVKNLFCHLPVRKQQASSSQCKKEGLKEIEHLLMAYSIVNTGLRITLRHNGNQIWCKNRCSDIVGSLSQAFGHTIADRLLRIQADGISYALEAFIPKPNFLRESEMTFSSPDRMFFFVNDRPVRLPKVSKMLHNYTSIHLKGLKKYPVAVVSLNVSPSEIDVNLEPNKMKVLLKCEEEILQSLKTLLDEVPVAAEVTLKNPEIVDLNTAARLAQRSSQAYTGENEPMSNTPRKNIHNKKDNHISNEWIDSSLHFKKVEWNSSNDGKLRKKDVIDLTGFTSSDCGINASHCSVSSPNKDCARSNFKNGNFLGSFEPINCFKPKTFDAVSGSSQFLPSLNTNGMFNELCKNQSNLLGNEDFSTTGPLFLESSVDTNSSAPFNGYINRDLNQNFENELSNQKASDLFLNGEEDIYPKERLHFPDNTAFSSDDTVLAPLPPDIKIWNNASFVSRSAVSTNQLLDVRDWNKAAVSVNGSASGHQDYDARGWSRGNSLGGTVKPFEIFTPGIHNGRNSLDRVMNSNMQKQGAHKYSQSKLGRNLRNSMNKENDTAYTAFCREEHVKVADENPGADFFAIGRIISEKWKNLSNEEKFSFQSKVKEKHISNTETRKNNTQDVIRVDKFLNKACNTKAVSNSATEDKILSVKLADISWKLNNPKPNTTQDCIVGPLNSYSGWAVVVEDVTGILNPWRVLEIKMFKQLMMSAKVEAETLSEPITIRKSSCSEAIWDGIANLVTDDSAIIDDRLTFNGVEGFVYKDSVSSDVSLAVTALPRNVPFFGMKDVEDILQRLVNVRNIEDARPLKIKHYLQVSVSLTNSLEFSL
ncbi:hypothetical protein QYM36_016929 [Artemia franciscana]|uniref:HMG box domain-containing protein n=1 Tax=Artemia franciscana TaxID=6661 RepID=A0AA88KSG9_ARTSF|nr:hypothetical protein QYM36_016929 [Artemia franciscana]